MSSAKSALLSASISWAPRGWPARTAEWQAMDAATARCVSAPPPPRWASSSSARSLAALMLRAMSGTERTSHVPSPKGSRLTP